MFSSERNELEEIILRLVLLTGDFCIYDDGELCKTVKFDIENTCFRLPFFTFEKELTFCLFFNRNNFEQFHFFIVLTRFNNADDCFIPNDKSSYLDLIYYVTKSPVDSIKNDVLDSIMNWDELILGGDIYIFELILFKKV